LAYVEYKVFCKEKQPHIFEKQLPKTHNSPFHMRRLAENGLSVGSAAILWGMMLPSQSDWER
jgi:hypothetical protein